MLYGINPNANFSATVSSVLNPDEGQCSTVTLPYPTRPGVTQPPSAYQPFPLERSLVEIVKGLVSALVSLLERVVGTLGTGQYNGPIYGFNGSPAKPDSSCFSDLLNMGAGLLEGVGNGLSSITKTGSSVIGGIFKGIKSLF